MQTICKNCKSSFTTFPSRKRCGKSKYCSRKCWSEAKTFSYVCMGCKEEFLEAISQHKHKFCTLECKRKYALNKKKLCPCGRIATKRRFCSFQCYWDSLKLSPEELAKRRKEYTRKYRAMNPEKTQTWKQNRRSREINAEGTFSEIEWKTLKHKFKDLCAICKKKKKLTVDHIIPLSKGGSNYISNIQPLCINCNSQKSFTCK